MATVEQIIRDVEICLDEIALNDAEFDDADCASQDNAERATIIQSKIADALRFVYSNADSSLLEPDEVVTLADPQGYSVKVTEQKVGIVALPDNFLRLCFAHFVSWSRFCGSDDILSWGDKAYSMLKDKYCTGTPDRPKIAIGWGEGGKKQLELYSAKDDSDTMRVGWILEPKKNEGQTDSYNIPEKVYRACIYYIAGLVLTTYRNANGASMMFKEANDLMGFTTASPRVAPVNEEE